MGIENKFGISQATFYFIIFVLSFFVCIPVGLNVDDFEGHCLLSSSGTWHKDVNPSVSLEISQWGRNSACNFSIFIGVVSLLLSLFYCLWTGILLAKGLQSSWLDSFINLSVNTVLSVCLFATALTLSIGLNDWCSLLTQPVSGIDSCERAQYIDLGLASNIRTNRFYTHWKMAEFGVWCSWILWLVLVVMSFVRQYSYHRREAFRTSINRERQRLLQRVNTLPETA